MKKKKKTLLFYRTALALLFYINSLKNWSELLLNGRYNYTGFITKEIIRDYINYITGNLQPIYKKHIFRFIGFVLFNIRNIYKQIHNLEDNNKQITIIFIPNIEFIKLKKTIPNKIKMFTMSYVYMFGIILSTIVGRN